MPAATAYPRREALALRRRSRRRWPAGCRRRSGRGRRRGRPRRAGWPAGAGRPGRGRTAPRRASSATGPYARPHPRGGRVNAAHRNPATATGTGARPNSGERATPSPATRYDIPVRASAGESATIPASSSAGPASSQARPPPGPAAASAGPSGASARASEAAPHRAPAGLRRAGQEHRHRDGAEQPGHPVTPPDQVDGVQHRVHCRVDREPQRQPRDRVGRCRRRRRPARPARRATRRWPTRAAYARRERR